MSPATAEPTDATTLPVALFNYQNGGMLQRGSYDFEPLKRAFADVKQAPMLVLLCEAKYYGDNDRAGLRGAAAALSEQLDRPFEGVLGWCERGPFGPAIFYDPTELDLTWWWDVHDRPGDEADDRANLARFRYQSTGLEFLALVQHWDFRSGDVRLLEAKRIDRYGEDEPLPVIVGGDFNSVPSGPHFDTRDWDAASYRSRSQKGRRLPDGIWEADTAALDHLIGWWDSQEGRRVAGCGFSAVAELAVEQGMSPEEAYLPTVNTGIDAGGGLQIDHLLVNPAMAPRLIPGTHKIHIPPADQPKPSDHRLVRAAFDMAIRP